MKAAILLGTLILDALLLTVAFVMGYYLGATSAPPMTIVEVEGGVE